ncbi:hypothetical protein D3C72_1544250 [compost metagenome]
MHHGVALPDLGIGRVLAVGVGGELAAVAVGDVLAVIQAHAGAEGLRIAAAGLGVLAAGRVGVEAVAVGRRQVHHALQRAQAGDVGEAPGGRALQAAAGHLGEAVDDVDVALAGDRDAVLGQGRGELVDGDLIAGFAEAVHGGLGVGVEADAGLGELRVRDHAVGRRAVVAGAIERAGHHLAVDDLVGVARGLGLGRDADGLGRGVRAGRVGLLDRHGGSSWGAGWAHGPGTGID